MAVLAGRLHYIDRCRALLMLLGIPYHTGMMFSSDWGPPQGAASEFCAIVAQTLTVFRMPAFFLIAGFFAAMILARTMRGAWLRSRIVRLGIPLVSATLLILPVQMFVSAIYPGGDLAATFEAWAAKLQTPAQHWISHLWFLHDLITYSVIMTAAWPIVRRISAVELPATIERQPFVALFLLVGAVAVPLTLAAPVLSTTTAGWIVSRLLHNGVFFLLGAALFLRREVFDRWLVWRWWRALLVIATIAAAVLLAIDGDHERPAMFVGWYAAIGGAWLVLAAMKRWGDAPNPVVAFFVDASLTIYLVHHPIIYALGLVTAATALPPEVEWLAVACGTAMLSTGIYLLTLQGPPVYFLFNGQRLPATRIAKGAAA